MQKKINVLWLINTVLPQAAEAFNQKQSVSGGWLTALIKGIAKDDSIALTVVYPDFGGSGVKRAEKDGVIFYCVGMPGTHHLYHSETEAYFKDILSKENPDIVHIFGTEFPHTLAMVRAFNTPDRTLIHIQGLCTFYEQHYLEGIPDKIAKRRNIKELINGKGLLYDHRLFVMRGQMEAEALNHCGHVSGRTTWDKACALQINDKARYHHCNESMRDAFYAHQWDIKKADRHTVFISQASYPIKGFQYAVQAFALVVKRYPDAKMFVAGSRIFSYRDRFIKRYFNNAYIKYIRSLIEKFGLENHIIFTGDLTEDEMCAQYLKAHVFVSPSAIENSPNSVGEAMLLGVPCVCSDVGGVKDLLTHQKEGYVYQSAAPYMLAYYISELFENDETALRFSSAARKRAEKTHDREANVKRTREIYDIIIREAGE